MPIVIRSGQDLVFFLLTAKNPGSATSYNSIHTGLNWHRLDPVDAAANASGSKILPLNSVPASIGHGRVNGQLGWVLGGGTETPDEHKLFTATSRVPSSTTFDTSSPIFEPTEIPLFIHYSETYGRWIAGEPDGHVLRSNNGADWSESLSEFTSADLRKLAEDDSNGTWMIAAGDGLWRSTNGGSNWSQVLTMTGSSLNMKSIYHANGTWIQVDQNAIRRSTNAGDTWSAGIASGGQAALMSTDGTGTWAYAFKSGAASALKWHIKFSTNDGQTFDNSYNTEIPAQSGAADERALGYFENKWFLIGKSGGVWRWDDITVNVKTQLMDELPPGGLGSQSGAELRVIGAAFV